MCEARFRERFRAPRFAGAGPPEPLRPRIPAHWTSAPLSAQGHRKSQQQRAAAAEEARHEVDAQVEAEVLAGAYWRRAALRQCFDALRHARGTPVGKRQPSQSLAHRPASRKASAARPVAARAVRPEPRPSERGHAFRRAFDHWTRAAEARRKASSDTECTEAMGAFSLLTRGFAVWRRDRKARADARDAMSTALWHRLQRVVLGWCSRTARQRERMAREAVIASLLQASRRVRCHRRFLLRLQQLNALSHIWSSWCSAGTRRRVEAENAAAAEAAAAAVEAAAAAAAEAAAEAEDDSPDASGASLSEPATPAAGVTQRLACSDLPPCSDLLARLEVIKATVASVS